MACHVLCCSCTYAKVGAARATPNRMWQRSVPWTNLANNVYFVATKFTTLNCSYGYWLDTIVLVCRRVQRNKNN